ncbi:MAG: DUF2333 family protein [Gammaproteobacteria bacterium]|nr:DUF2333 family protein [Gammaproteobacteria bacterium]
MNRTIDWKRWIPLAGAGDRAAGARKSVARTAGALIALYLAGCLALTWWWDFEPGQFAVRDNAAGEAQRSNRQVVTGYTTTASLIRLAQTLLDKRGGYLSNDLFPPGVWMDNVPNWEFGVLTQVRDAARAYRIDFARSQSQSREDPDLAQAEGKFFFDNSSWVFPPSESEYGEGADLLRAYLERLSDPTQPDAQFYARADNLQQWLQGVETRLGSLSQRLSASVGKRQLNVDLAGDSAAVQATDAPLDRSYKTPWLEIDDVFYQARGQTWALLHLLRAMEHDFGDVLDKKNARVSLQQIIRELESTQQAIWSPMILNGDGLGLLANHSLVMASYISRANAAIIDLRALLAQG